MQKKIEIYSTETCHFCHMAKDFFNAHNLAFTDYNVGKDPQKLTEMREKSGQLGVPVIVIDGGEVIVGFDQNRLANILGVSA